MSFTVQTAANTYFESVKKTKTKQNKKQQQQISLWTKSFDCWKIYDIIELSECISRLDITDKGIK